VAGTLRALGVKIVPAQADKHDVAACELGVTGVDAALPETGTLQLYSSPERPRVVSLLPRVHLAIFTPAALCADPHQAFANAKNIGYSVLVTGPSRTSDIELTLTLGVHGPKSLYAWVMSES
jgi:L-lactate dehydrogenase complex protein LldG